uniref:Uncharacterized protein n=1 Tax=Odontella aurita TaxID=265563 RepID=A0A6U6I2K0_9STRA|mmetsp:Transcript_50510/g.152154  ORF Transcript_50510/g.152154 Transcript_50510/m.152154 type:complete len:529 (+) Transcript_50510:201-1787(+)|eukprot:CAMPEP_0113545242 /NCGR_PEP_ID=MMETSP0015_2-20120614/11153_1 /TAXON_ID=2838 /ORGANISM="Odontella" /LENGTH=528 /DNA_ID=CAMNT_0000445587 /DNA_START=199 /DNA_END=1785 /DNA_ORIENTATION=+ /assembly_acc=CAM_ASM_000160
MKLSSFSFALVALTGASVSAFTVPSQSRGGKVTFASSPARLFGILDEVNSDSFDLLGGGNEDAGPSRNQLEEAYEILLADIIFSTNDPRLDIVENFERTTDADFLGWLNAKFENSRDPEEKAALRDLYEMILDVKKRVELSQAAEEREAREREEAEEARLVAAEAEAEEGKALSDTDVLRRAAAVDTAGVADAKAKAAEERKKKTFYETDLTPEIRASYEDLLKKVLPPYKPGDSPASIVLTNYDQFDAQFIKVLNERKDNGDEDTSALLDALANEQQKRLAAATETLKEVLSLGEPMRMEGAIVKLARDGRIDEPFLLLLEANSNQAEAAGAKGPAELMRRLGNRAAQEKDKQSSSKEIKLLRQLLREEDAAEREKILEDAFIPKEGLIVPGTMENAQRAADGEMPEEEKPMPDVPPPDFINACKAVTINFGNLSAGDDDDRGDLTARIKAIAAEAEVVATRIYGKGMTAREQQDRMWSEQTASIFDLERLEMEAEQMGTKAPWTTDDENMGLPGFDSDGKMKVGGS